MIGVDMFKTLVQVSSAFILGIFIGGIFSYNKGIDQGILIKTSETNASVNNDTQQKVVQHNADNSAYNAQNKSESAFVKVVYKTQIQTRWLTKIESQACVDNKISQDMVDLYNQSAKPTLITIIINYFRS